jgi:hypothetical protein
MKTIANVYLLPTESSNNANNIHIESEGKMVLVHGAYIKTQYHLYISIPQSDLEISKIKEGDWCINTGGNISDSFPFQPSKGVINNPLLKIEKIIATTNSELLFHDKKPIGENLNGLWKILPSIQQSFIEHFISEYNNRNIIKHVEVELVWVNRKRNHSKEFILKLNQQNEISIVISEEKMYSREEVETLLEKFYETVTGDWEGIPYNHRPKVKDWLKQNLK